jgi:hypothetical protein
MRAYRRVGQRWGVSIPLLWLVLLFPLLAPVVLLWALWRWLGWEVLLILLFVCWIIGIITHGI